MARVYLNAGPGLALWRTGLIDALRPLMDDGAIELLGLGWQDLADDLKSGLPQLRADNVDDGDMGSADVVLLVAATSDLAGARTAVARDLDRARREGFGLDAIVVLLEPVAGREVPLDGFTVVDGAGRGLLNVPEQEVAAVLAEVRDLVARRVAELPRARVQRLEVSRLSAFEQVDLELVPGINVLIGRNGTGKTHLMKLIYAALWLGAEERTRPLDRDGQRRSYRLQEKLTGLFKPAEDSIKRLRRRGRETEGAGFALTCDKGTCRAAFDQDGRFSLEDGRLPVAARPVFLPSRDALALFEGLVALYEERQISLDETFRDLAVALDRPLLIGRSRKAADSQVEDLEQALGGRFQNLGRRFYLRAGRLELEAHLVGEGLRRVGTLDVLISNGTLTRDSVLLWDEPEANLNPSLVKVAADVIGRLAAWGVQIVVATHDYLLAQRLSLASEHGAEDAPTCRFFSLYRAQAEGPVAVEVAERFIDLEHNAIRDEFEALYDLRLELMARDHGGTGGAT